MSFGRVRELWYLDMGMRCIGELFDLLDEEEYEMLVNQHQEWQLDDEEFLSDDNDGSMVGGEKFCNRICFSSNHLVYKHELRLRDE